VAQDNGQSPRHARDEQAVTGFLGGVRQVPGVRDHVRHERGHPGPPLRLRVQEGFSDADPEVLRWNGRAVRCADQ